MQQRCSMAPLSASPTSRRPGSGLDFGAVDLWLTRLDVDAEALARLRGLLDEDERRRAERFHFARDAARFVAGRGALKTILGALLAVDPARIHLVYGAQGKPELAEPFDREGLRFNLSHSEDVAICAVTRERRIGVDIERVRPLADWEAIAQRVFTGQETRALRRLSETDRPAAFFACWTRHEAQVKAAGQTLAGRRDLASSDDWTLRTFSPEPGYLATVAVAGSISRLITRAWSPAHA
jgi:4'-phosphopantetheinyl transferase